MRLKNNSLIADLAFLCMLLLLMICIMFMMQNYDNLQRNTIALATVFATVIITYFTSLSFGLVINIALIFGYSIYIILSSAYKGVSIEAEVYFWIVWSPLMTVSSYLFTGRTLLAEKENLEMRERIKCLSESDALTGLKNMRGFEQDGLVYMKISHRYNLELVMLIWQFRFQKELTQMIGEDGINKLVKEISLRIADSLREEDEIFMLDDDPYMWGTLLFTNSETTDIIIARIENQLKKIDVRNVSGKHAVQLDMRVGSARYSEEIKSPLQFLEQAKKSSEYDV
jgi:GGDEF domain-containing protein